MGREAYLAKIAFGRSAFLPSQEVSQSERYVQLASSQADLPPRYQNFNGNDYVQLYDERGNPMNPRSHEYGKRLRNAQNDVLAAVGVVERRTSPDDGLPAAYAARLEELQDEDTAGSLLALLMSLAEPMSLWWTSALRDRILAFVYPDDMSFGQIIASEFSRFGRPILYAGLPARFLSAICKQSVLYRVFVHRPIERILLATIPTSQARKVVRRCQGLLRFGLRVATEVIFYPLLYHAELQRLGLLPARPLFPPWPSLNPSSHASPILPLSIYYNATDSALDCFKAALTSPVVLVCALQLSERWLHSTISQAVESSIIRPDNPDIKGGTIDDERRLSAILGLRGESPRSIRKAINRILVALGWGMPYTEDDTINTSAGHSFQHAHLRHRASLDVGTTTIENITPLVIPISQAQTEPEREGAIHTNLPVTRDGGDATGRPPTPPTPTLFEFEDGDDPRIRITNRDNIVEMEVRLPPRILSSQTEVVESPTNSHNRREAQTQNTHSSPTNRPQHRVSQLSTRSSYMLGTMVNGQLVSLALLPLRLVVVRLIASRYISDAHGNIASRQVMTLPGLKELTWGSVGTQISRVALCTALQVSINLSLWGLQYLTAVQIGKGFFGWGSL